jgi:hypothetical protein
MKFSRVGGFLKDDITLGALSWRQRLLPTEQCWSSMSSAKPVLEKRAYWNWQNVRILQDI